MEVPQHFIMLHQQTEAGRTRQFLYNSKTTEKSYLPEDKVLELEMDDSTGQKFLGEEGADEDADTVWASDFFKLHVLKDENGVTYLHSTTHGPLNFESEMRVYSTAQLQLCKEGNGVPATKVRSYVFTRPQGEHSRVFVDMVSFYETLGLKLYPGTGKSWFTQNKHEFRRLTSNLGFDCRAVADPVQYESMSMEKAIENQERFLDFGSMSLSVLLPALMRGGYGQGRPQGLLQDGDAVNAYQRVVGGLLKQLPDKCSWTVVLDADFRLCGGVLVGRHPWKFVVQEGMATFEGLDAAGAASLPHLSRALKNQRKTFIDMLADFNGNPLIDVVQSVFNKAQVKKSPEDFKILWPQLVRVIVHELEALVLKCVPHMSADGSSVDAVNPVGGIAHVESATNMLDLNWWQLQRRLVSYQQLQKASRAGGRNTAMCGPDGTKVGTDLVLNFAYIMDKRRRVASACPPQLGKTYLSWEEHRWEDDALEISRNEFERFESAAHALHEGRGVKRKSATWPQAPRKGQKTYQTFMHVDNMMRQTGEYGCDKLSIQRQADGSLGDPWQWHGLTTVSDRGPDLVALYHWASYSPVKMNWEFVWDTSHDGQSCGKLVLKRAGL